MADTPPSSASKRRQPTILDVARVAGVSVGTVSRFLNQVPIREVKRLAVEAAIAELKYTRNAAASSMRTERSMLIASLVPGYGEFFGQIVTSLNTRLTEGGLVLLTHQHDRDHRALMLALQFFREHRVNAVIMPGVPTLRSEVEALTELGIPVILFNNDMPDIALDRVFSRNAEGAFDGVRYLVDMGHRRIGFIGGDPSESSATERRAGYERGMRHFGLAIEPSLVVGDAWSRDLAYAHARQLHDLPEPPTAILTASVDLALGVMDYARDAGLRIGEDMSLVSFDDAEIFRQSHPSITSIGQPTQRIGIELAELVIAHVNGTHPGRPREIRIPCTIRLGASVKRI